MKPALLLPLVALLLGVAPSCNQSAPVVEQPATPPPPPVPGPDLMSLADSNIVAKLTPYLAQYPGSEVIIRTRLGDMRVRLYDDTPIHKANFLLLARKGVFDETLFNRVEQNLVIQGGRSTHRTIQLHRYHLPPEVRAEHFHKKGALAMARYDDEQNPDQLSSSIDFYLVQGTKLAPNQSKALAGRKLTPAQVQTYDTLGGLPSLDGKYTVFGEIVEGLDVLDKIAAVPIDAYKWPKKDVDIKMEVVQ